MAKDVTVKWSFDAPGFAPLLASPSRGTGETLMVNGLEFYFEGKGKRWQPVGEDEAQRIGTIRPLPDGEPKDVRVNWAYHMLLEEQLKAICCRQSADPPSTGDLPILTVNVRYRDIEGNLYRKTIAITPRLGMFSPLRSYEELRSPREIAHGRFLSADV